MVMFESEMLEIWAMARRTLCATCLAGLLGASALQGGIAKADALGDRIYDERCSACHQANGQGIPSVFPALDGNPHVTGSASDIIRIVLTGRGQMPNFKAQLDDQAIAAVTTYIRNSWGNHASAVTEGDVKAVRTGATEAK